MLYRTKKLGRPRNENKNVGRKFGDWVVVENLGKIAPNNKKSFVKLINSKSKNKNEYIVIREDNLSKFNGKNINCVSIKTKNLQKHFKSKKTPEQILK